MKAVTNNTVTLTIDVSPGVDPDDVITDINAAVLCGLEEDKQMITGWCWSRQSTVTTVSTDAEEA